MNLIGAYWQDAGDTILNLQRDQEYRIVKQVRTFPQAVVVGTARVGSQEVR